MQLKKYTLGPFCFAATEEEVSKAPQEGDGTATDWKIPERPFPPAVIFFGVVSKLQAQARSSLLPRFKGKETYELLL